VPSDQFDDDVYRGIGQNLLGILHQHAGRENDAPIARDIHVGDANEFDGHANTAADECRIIQ
jgi:hypothetical protein